MGCKNQSSNIKVLLNNIFPAGICDMICDYNLHCLKCNELLFKENEYDRYAINRYTKVEQQIDFFQTEMTSPIFISQTNRTNVRQMRREIDVLMDTLRLKQLFQRDKMFLQAIKSYVKRTLNILIISFLTFMTLI